MNLHEVYLAAQIAAKGGGSADLSDYYSKSETDQRITAKVAEIVVNSPEDFDTLKEISDWIASHEDSAAAMNTAIVANTTAITTKVDKEPGKGLSTNDFADSDKSKLDSLENYDDSEVKSEIALNRSTLGYHRKNLLKLSATTQTKAGVTYTVNDGLINASGTTTRNSTYIMFETEVPQIFDKDVIVTYTGEITNIACNLRLGEAGSYNYPFVTKSGYRIPAGTKFSQVYLQQKNADVIVNVSDFGVMLRYAEITDDTYEPYKPSVQEQIDGITDRIFGLENDIKNGEDLNDYLISGVYNAKNSAIASSLSNCPFTSAGFRLEVMNMYEGTSDGRLIQKVVPLTQGPVSVFYRIRSSTGFNSWYKFSGEAVTTT